MPYDLCEDVTTLDYIESEMARRGQPPTLIIIYIIIIIAVVVGVFIINLIRNINLTDVTTDLCNHLFYYYYYYHYFGCYLLVNYLNIYYCAFTKVLPALTQMMLNVIK